MKVTVRWLVHSYGEQLWRWRHCSNGLHAEWARSFKPITRDSCVRGGWGFTFKWALSVRIPFGVNVEQTVREAVWIVVKWRLYIRALLDFQVDTQAKSRLLLTTLVFRVHVTLPCFLSSGHATLAVLLAETLKWTGSITDDS